MAINVSVKHEIAPNLDFAAMATTFLKFVGLEQHNIGVRCRQWATRLKGSFPNQAIVALPVLLVLRPFRPLDLIIMACTGFVLWSYREHLLASFASVMSSLRPKGRAPFVPQVTIRSATSPDKHVNNKLVAVDAPTAGDYDNRASNDNKLFPAGHHLRFVWRSSDQVVDLSSVKPVGIFGSQKVGKTTLINSLFGLSLATGNRAGLQTTTGIDMSVKGGFAILDTEGADSEDAMATTRQELARLLSRPDNDPELFAYCKRYRESIELALMVVAMAVCDPIIYCIKNPNAVTGFVDKVVRAAKMCADNDKDGKRTLIVVLNRCERTVMEDEARVEPGWSLNLRASPQLNSLFSIIKTVHVPDFRESRDVFSSQVAHIREIINHHGDSLSMDHLSASVSGFVGALPHVLSDHYVNVGSILEAANTELKERVLLVLQQKFAQVAANFNGMTLQDLDGVKAEMWKRMDELVPSPTLKSLLRAELEGWMDTEYDTRYRECAAPCGCLEQAPCTLGSITHDGDHKCRGTRSFSCPHGCRRMLRCNDDDGCNHCLARCSKHDGLCSLPKNSHAPHIFACRSLQKCSGCNNRSNDPANCGPEFFCAQCRCKHNWVKYHPVRDGKGIFKAHWECITPGCRYHNDAWLYWSIKKHERMDGCVVFCDACQLVKS